MSFRFLFFRPVRIDLANSFSRWFIYILVVTWLAGVGRYWDHPSAETWQYLGLGSIAYIFVLSAVVFLVIWPLRPARWRFGNVLVFVGLTSLPALLYATPVERFTDIETAQRINAWFLGAVAAWRVALLVRFFRTYAQLGWLPIVTVTVMILSGIIAALAILNLEHVVFDLMAGIREDDVSPNDMAYKIVLGLAFVSVYLFPITLFIYLGMIAVSVAARIRGE